LEVLRLIRVAIGPLQLGNLPKGATRALTPDEVRNLSRVMA
jgi:23S rRNA pseudouridine2605 synthase